MSVIEGRPTPDELKQMRALLTGPSSTVPLWVLKKLFAEIDGLKHENESMTQCREEIVGEICAVNAAISGTMMLQSMVGKEQAFQNEAANLASMLLRSKGCPKIERGATYTLRMEFYEWGSPGGP